MPRGGTAFRSIKTLSAVNFRQTDAGRSVTPDAPAQTTTAQALRASAKASVLDAANGVIAPPVVSLSDSARAAARSRLREPTDTLAPCRQSKRAARCPTGPVAASTAAETPSTDPPIL